MAKIRTIRLQPGELIKEKLSPSYSKYHSCLRFFKIKERDGEKYLFGGEVREIPETSNQLLQCSATIQVRKNFDKNFRVVYSNEMFRMILAVIRRGLRQPKN
jgi:hypothetical protein